MLKLICACIVSLVAGMALAQESAIGDETPAADQAKDKAEASTAAEAKKEEFTPPPGFKTKKRGKITVYCIQDSTVGTRFKTEKCYDEAQIHDYLLAREQANREFDQRRAICSNSSVCAP
jgi:hypothetical protein